MTKILIDKETVELALEALESVTGHFTRTPSTLRDSEVRGEAHKAITALRQALEQSTEQETETCMGCNVNGVVGNILDTDTCPFCEGSGIEQSTEQDHTYGYAKGLAETIFKQHFASDEHYASGRIVWGVNDTVIGILTQIDNMVADMVRKPEQAQKQEPVAWIVEDKHGERLEWAGDVHSCHGVPTFRLYTSPPQRQPLTDEMVVAAARVLNDIQADACGVDRDDQWTIYSDGYKADALAMLKAAHGIKENT